MGQGPRRIVPGFAQARSSSDRCRAKARVAVHFSTESKARVMTRPFEILLVEDNEADVEMVRRSLRQLVPACSLTAARDGSEALDCLFKRGKFADVPRPHLVFLDLNMPGMNG